MRFEVFLPATDPDGFDVTLHVDAANWMEALRLGLQRTQADERAVRNVFCDIKENDLLHVTDLASRRVFKIRRIAADEPLPAPPGPARAPAPGIPTVPDATASAPSRFRYPHEFPAVRAEAPEPLRASTLPAVPASATPTVEVPRLKNGQPLGITSETGVFRTIGSREIEIVTLVDAEQPHVLLEHVIPTQEHPAFPPIGRDLSAEYASVAESPLEDVFLEAAGLFEGESSLEHAVAFALDLALKYISAESGSVLFTEEGGSRLYFAAARGPKAAEILAHDFHVPIDQGIVGFCARRGVSLAISDASQDPRFYREISEELGYPSRSILCAPVQFEGRAFGAIELVNHREREHFTGSELNILTYVGSQAGRFIQNLLA